MPGGLAKVCWCRSFVNGGRTLSARCVAALRSIPHASRFLGVWSMRASRAHFLHAFARFGPTTCLGLVGRKLQKARSEVVRRQGLEPRTRRLRDKPGP